MIKKSGILILTFMFLLVLGASAGNKDKKVKNGEKEDTKDIILKPDTLLIPEDEITDQRDDTLVFEDWDDSEGNGDANYTSIASGGTEGMGDEHARDINPSALTQKLKDIHERKYEVNFQIFPNPAVSELHVAFEDKPSAIRVYSITGVLMFETTEVRTIDVRGYAPGAYLIQLVYEDHVESRKFVKRT